MHDTPDTIQFLFNLEEVLIERKIASSIHGVKRPLILFFVNCLSKRYTEFQFKEPFYDWVMRDSGVLREMHKKFQHETSHLEWKHLLRKACDHLNPDLETDAFTWDDTTGSVGSERGSYSTPEEVSEAEGRSELQQVRMEVSQLQQVRDQLQSELQQVRMEVSQLQQVRDQLQSELQQVRDQLQQVRSEPQQVRAPRPANSVPIDCKLVLQSVTSKRPFARARQRVALLVIFISGLKVSKLLLLKVRDLKTLRQFAHSGELPAVTVREPGSAKEMVTYLIDDFEMLIGDRPESTPAFRANYNSPRPCTREAFYMELNQILSQWGLSTKSFSKNLPP